MNNYNCETGDFMASIFFRNFAKTFITQEFTYH